MTISAHATGTLSATAGGTEDFLTSPNVAGSFQLVVDLVNMAAGDVVTLRLYQMVLTGGTYRQVYAQRFEGVQQGDKITASAIVNNELTDTNSVRASLTQEKGSSRNFPWKLLKFS